MTSASCSRAVEFSFSRKFEPRLSLYQALLLAQLRASAGRHVAFRIPGTPETFAQPLWSVKLDVRRGCGALKTCDQALVRERERVAWWCRKRGGAGAGGSVGACGCWLCRCPRFSSPQVEEETAAEPAKLSLPASRLLQKPPNNHAPKHEARCRLRARLIPPMSMLTTYKRWLFPEPWTTQWMSRFTTHGHLFLASPEARPQDD